VCGITPYDATHIGHAATYLAYDTLIRVWLDAGYDVRYVQNTTDVDDPLLERAAATGVDWRALAAEQTELFRRDMECLGVIPPDHYAAATEMIEQVADAVRRLLDRGTANSSVSVLARHPG
jgi:L-cysteine:1D-myo-inositol 2-amino-2-deoxy-alpha-D-glucopyranoside ligase